MVEAGRGKLLKMALLEYRVARKTNTSPDLFLTIRNKFINLYYSRKCFLFYALKLDFNWI